MGYPDRLLPKPKDVKILKLPLEHVLVRWTEPGIQVFNNDGELNPAALSEKFFFGYSTNKIPPSNIDDTTIRILNNDLLEYWNEGEDAMVPKDDEFEYVNDRGYLLFSIGDIHNFTATYPYPQKREIVKLHFRLNVSHKPLHCNYPHFEFTILDNDLKEIEQGGGKWRKEIIFAIRVKMIKIVKPDLKEFPRLYE